MWTDTQTRVKTLPSSILRVRAVMSEVQVDCGPITEIVSRIWIFLALQISPGSTADELRNDDEYPLFLRTVHTDSNEAMAITGVIKAMGWTYVSIVHSGRYFKAHTKVLKPTELTNPPKYQGVNFGGSYAK